MQTPSNRIKKAIAAGLIGVTALSSAAVVPAIADAQEAPTEERQADRQERRAERQALFAELLGIDVSDLAAAIEADQSLADVAAAQGVSLDAVVDAVVEMRSAALAERVAEGNLSQERFDAIVAEMPERITERLSTTPSEFQAAREARRAERLSVYTETLGLSVEELQAARDADQSLADIAADQGVDIQTLIDAIVAEKSERLDAAVAEGRITQEQADERADRIEERVAERVNTSPSERPERGDRGPRGQRGGN